MSHCGADIQLDIAKSKNLDIRCGKWVAITKLSSPSAFSFYTVVSKIKTSATYGKECRAQLVFSGLSQLWLLFCLDEAEFHDQRRRDETDREFDPEGAHQGV